MDPKPRFNAYTLMERGAREYKVPVAEEVLEGEDWAETSTGVLFPQTKNKECAWTDGGRFLQLRRGEIVSVFVCAGQGGDS